jgi:GNAT superfamily N-acetyltransferase
MSGIGPRATFVTRWSSGADAPELAAVHAAAWRYAYAGLIPGLDLERMVARRGPRWWTRLHARGGRALVLELPLGFDAGATGLGGYATLGAGRHGGAGGEIYELYLRPELHGVGFGRRLFEESRRVLAAHGSRRLTVWALAENEVACRFYRAMGGIEAGRGVHRVSGVELEKVGFVWE